jgi:hypothetical protein
MDRANMRERLQIAQAKLREIRQVQRSGASNMAQRVAAGVAIGRGVRHFSGADTVEHNPGDAAKRRRH